MLRRIIPALVISLSVLVGAVVHGHAASSPAGTHTLGKDPNALAFAYSIIGGNTLAGSYKVSIYNSGKVTLTGSTRIRLQNPDTVLSPQTLRGLMRLADSIKFFSLSTPVKGKLTNPDLPSHRLTVKSATAIKTVEELHVANERFDELYAVLAGLTPRCIGDGTSSCFAG